jgi:hypothetical protein
MLEGTKSDIRINITLAWRSEVRFKCMRFSLTMMGFKNQFLNLVHLLNILDQLLLYMLPMPMLLVVLKKEAVTLEQTYLTIPTKTDKAPT